MEPEIVLKVVDDLCSMYPIISILAILEISKSTYYRWKKKYGKASMNPIEELIMSLCEENHFRYGHRKIKALLKYKCQHKYVHFHLDKDVQNHSFSFAK